MTPKKSTAWLTASGWLWLALAGCANWATFKPPVADVKPQREKRAQDVAKRYEQHRDAAQYGAAVACWNQGNSQGCRELLEKVLDRNPEHRESGLLMAELLLLDGDIAHARGQINDLAAHYPDDAEVLHSQGLVEAAAGDDASAAHHFERACKLAPDNPIFAASFEAAQESQQPSSRRRADPILSSQTAATRRGTARLSTFQVSAELWKAEVWLSLERPSETLTILERVLDEDPSQAEAEHMAGRAAERAGFATEAAAHYRRAAELEPDRVRYQTSLAASSETVSSINERAGTKRAGFDTISENSNAPHVTGGTFSMGESSRNGFNARDGGNSPLTARQWFDRGKVALTAGAPESALSYFQRARRSAPRDEEMTTSAAVLLLRNEQPELADRLAQDALTDLPDSAALYRIQGMARYRMGEWKSAQVSLEQAVTLDKSQPLAYFLLGCTLKKLGEPAAAESYLRQARQLDPRFVAE